MSIPDQDYGVITVHAKITKNEQVCFLRTGLGHSARLLL